MAWVAVQKKGFEHWCNAKFSASRSSSRITDLASDFCDGVLLGELVELLSGKRVATINKPKMKLQKLANIVKSLEVVKSEEIKLVNTSAEDIHDGSIKIILGLVWTLILKYQIQAAAQEPATSSTSSSQQTSSQTSSLSPKEELLKWLQAQVANSGVPCNDFQKSFQDGKLLCALVNSLRPGLINWTSLDSLTPLKRTLAAVDAATLNFDVLCILDPEDIVKNPDELCMMTYVAMFRVAARCLKPATAQNTAAVATSASTAAANNPDAAAEVEQQTEDLLNALENMGLTDHKDEDDDSYDDVYAWMGEERKKKWYAFIDKSRLEQKSVISNLTTQAKAKGGLPRADAIRIARTFVDGVAVSLPKLWEQLFEMIEEHFQRIVTESTKKVDDDHKERAMKLALRVWRSARQRLLNKLSATCAEYKQEGSMFMGLLDLPEAGNSKKTITQQALTASIESAQEMVGFDLDASVGMFNIRKEHQRVEEILQAALGPNISKIELACANYEGFATYNAWLGHGSFLAHWTVFCKRNRVYLASF